MSAKRKSSKKSPFLTALGTIIVLVILLVRMLSGGEDVQDASANATGVPESAVNTAATQPAAAETPARTADVKTSDSEEDIGLTMHVLEVGKADCLVLECDGEYMIIDGGNEGDEAYILEKLEELGVSEFKYLVNTHPHEDHLGSLDAVIYEYPVEQAYISPKEHTTQNYERLLTALDDRDVPTEVPEVGDVFKLGGATFTVLSPDKNADYDGYNDWSIVLMAQYGDVRYLLTGDAETPVEGDLLESSADLRADVLKLGHHGSSTSSRKSFLTAVSPTWAIATCDGTETAGEPHEKVVRYLNELNIPYLRTDECGMISVYTDGEDIAITTEREP